MPLPPYVSHFHTNEGLRSAMEPVTVVCGPASCGKTQYLLTLYRGATRGTPAGSALWLTPTATSRAAVRERLLSGDLTCCFQPNCVTFDRLAQMVLDASDTAMRPITSLMKRELLRTVLADAQSRGKLKYFAPIAHTPGLLDQLAGFISEVKRLEIWPEELLAAWGGKGAVRKNFELHHLYDKYQQALNSGELFDFEGRLWSARALMRNGQLKPFENLQLLVVDGFSDFTRTQHEIIDILAQRARSVLVSLPLDLDESRRALFSKPLRTLAELRSRHPDLVLKELERRDAWPPGLAHIERHLFRNPRTIPAAAATDGLELLAAGGEICELEAVADRVKRLLLCGDSAGEGVRPADIVVVFRSLADRADAIREVFERFGIPVSVRAKEPLARSPVASALINILRLHLEDWQYRRLQSLLGSTFFRPAWSECHGRGAEVAREVVLRLQVFSGREQLLSRLRRLSEREPQLDGDGRPRGRVDRLAILAKPAHAVLDRLSSTLAALPERATATVWASSLTRLAQELGFLAAPHRQDVDTDADQAAWNAMIESLLSLDRLAVWRDRPRRALTQSELYERLLDTLRTEPLPADRDDVGRVRVLGALEARGVTAPYVFLAGLSETAFPPAYQPGRLYGDAQHDQLVKAGLPMSARREALEGEMLLFYEIITRAERKVVLSYPALDEAAHPLSPSPFVTEVERACGGAAIARQAEPDLSPVPRTADVACGRDWRVKAVSSALEGHSELLAGLCRGGSPSMGQRILSGFACLEERSRAGFGPFEGVLGARAQGVLEGRFGPERCWSPSQLEQYAYCPFRFFLQKVLNLEPSADPALGTDYLERGRLAHGFLAALHRRMNAKSERPASPCSGEESDFAAEVDIILAELFSGAVAEESLEGALREVDRRLVMEWSTRYRDQHRNYEAMSGCDEPLLPSYFEVAFGPQRTGDDDFEQIETRLSTQRPFELSCAEGTVRLTGRIDRIDVGKVAGKTVFNVIDYKSGSPARHNAGAIARGLAMQLPLYALAVQELLLHDQQAVPWQAAYWYVRGAGAKGILAFHELADGALVPTDEWRVLRQQLIERVQAMVQGIRQGQYPVLSADDDCTGTCPYKTVCRVQHVRSMEKTWQPSPASNA